MGFFLQLKLLVWKNFILRKRNKVRLVVEIVWPLFLFVILVLVRTRGLKQYNHSCYFDEKAMPSAGFVPFLQSFFCTFNNTCYDHEQKNFGSIQTYNDSFLTQLFGDVNQVFKENMNTSKSDSLARTITDVLALRKAWDKVKGKLQNGQALKGFSVRRADLLLKNPIQFRKDLLMWALDRGISWNDPLILQRILASGLKPESLQPSEFFGMIADPSLGLCDPKLVGKVFDISAQNLTDDELQEFLKPLCNMSMNEGSQIFGLLRDQINMEQVQNEFNEFLKETGGQELSWSDWQAVGKLSLDVREDLIETESIRKITGDLSNILKMLWDRTDALKTSNSSDGIVEQMEEEASEEFELFSGINRTTQVYVRLQKLFCGREIPASHLGSLFGSGADRLEEFRDRFKLGKDNSTRKQYEYDNSTSQECNDIMREFESSTFSQVVWRLIKPYVRGKILYTPDTPATRNLMQMVNASFEPVAQLRKLSLLWTENKDKIRGFLLDEENKNFIKDVFISRDPGNILERIFRDPVTQVLNDTGSQPLLFENNIRSTLDDYFEGNFTNTWNSTLDQIDNLMSNLSLYTSCFEYDKFIGMSSEHQLESHGMELVNQNKLWAGIVFTNVPNDQKSKDLPTFIRYKIRMDADSVDSTMFLEDRISRPGPRARRGIDLKYIYYGFAFLQDTLEHAIIAEQSGRNMSDLPGITLQQFPYPCYISDQFIMAISRTFPLFMTLAWVYACSMIIKSIVYEKEQRLKETMKVMGLGNGVHWMAWFIDSFAFMFISVFLLTIILKYGKVLTFSSPTLIFVFLLAYTVATISLSFFLSTLFSRANIAAAAGGIIFFCLYLPYTFMVVWEAKISHPIRIACSLLSNVAFGFGCAYFSYFEEDGAGAQWDNIWTSPQMSSGDEYSLAGCIGMLFVDAIFYGILTWYIEAVFPGQFGVPKPWYFFVTLNYWLGSEGKEGMMDGINLSESELELGEGGEAKKVEKEPSHLHLGVSVQHLHKIYSNGKVAIEDLNLNFYEGQITSFLGHNGAGKTTTISILTGMFPPSAGTAKINGMDIKTSIDKIRQSVGLCPQHNVLFDNMTVFEHLWFYARLKGRSEDVVTDEANRMIDDLGLPHKRDERSKNLSGGMQRKLSIASAFVGGSRVVILDEPTAGVDPYSRRSIWDLLIKYKPGRTIIMSTHFMDEADLLGDRIAIINNGKLVCVGSSLFLKARFGNGYYLTLVRDDGITKALEELEQDGQQQQQQQEGLLSPKEEECNSLEEVDGAEAASTIIENELEKSDVETLLGAALMSDAGNESNILKDSSEMETEVTMEEGSIKVEENEGQVVTVDPSVSGSNLDELDIMIDDEGISDVAKKNGFVINPSKAYEQAITYPITKFVTKYVSNARLLDHFGSELVYILPTDRQRGAGLENFETLFAALDRHMGKLQICSYGLSDTTLEEIFLKVASNIHDGSGGLRQIQYDDVTDRGRYAARTRSASARSVEARTIYLPPDQRKVLGMSDNLDDDEDESVFTERRQVQVTTDEGKTVTYTEVSTLDGGKSERSKSKPKVQKNFPPPQPEYTSQALFFKHLVALEVKRFHYARRNKKGLCCEILLPAAFVCLAMIFTLIVPPLENEQPLELHPWNYPTWGLTFPTDTFVATHHPKAEWPNRYTKQLMSKTSMGVRCLEQKPIAKLTPCMDSDVDTSKFWTPPHILNNHTQLDCSCSIGTMECPDMPERMKPPKVQLASYDIVSNLTSRNISDYLMKTTKDFKKRRYGGFEFGVGNPLAGLNITLLQEFLYGFLNTSGIVERLIPGLGDSKFVAEMGASLVEEFALTSGKLDNVRVWFNNKGWTSSMGYMNAANNLILRASIASKQEDGFDFDWNNNGGYRDPSKYGISVINHPMNFTATQLGRESIRQIAIGLLHAICIIFAMSFVPASFILFLIDERTTKMKHLQFVSSVRPLTYWVASILWDLSMYMITVIICIIIFIVFDAEAYISPESLPALFVLLFLFGWATIPLMYPSSFVFNIPSSAFVTLACINLFIGIITTIVVFVLENFDDDELKQIGSILKDVFLIFPQYCLGRGLLEMAIEYNSNLVASQFGLESVRSNRFAYDFVGKYMLCMFVQGVIFFCLTLAIEIRLWSSIKHHFFGFWTNRFRSSIGGLTGLKDDDEDVAVERRRVLESSTIDDVLVCRNLTKQYSGADKPAVDQLTFGVKRGECFGLLGVNGAGKTSTFKMLTGDTEPTSGTATVSGFNIKTQLSDARRNIGYCPQFDALNPLLTGREHLRFYARLRGLSENAVKKYTEWGLKRLGLIPYADRCAGTYSGGNKRKLSTAIALIGNPSLIFLDEPTTGMDPGARRLLWNCILDMIRGGQSVVLTSHSMEECEALCTRLAIMVNGKFQCLGSIQHLKNRFGSGYTLTVRCGVIESEALNRLRQFVEAHCPDATLQEGHVSQLQFHLPLKSTRLADIFHIMESARSDPDLNLEDYSISQLTLDEVFIQFASRQSETTIDKDPDLEMPV